LAVLDSLLDSCNHVCLRIPLNASTLTGAARRDIERLQRYFPGRVECQPRACLANRPLLFSECDLTLWPTAAENLGLVGLTSLAAGVPVVTFHAPPMDTIVQPLGGVLVPVTTTLDDYGVPQYRPAWEALYDQCVELVNDRETIQAFKQNIVDDERDRAKMFDTSLETALEA
jgi:glycosyltransferase involved in cell wall biosynthesis